MTGWMDEWTHGWMGGWIERQMMDGWMHGWMDEAAIPIGEQNSLMLHGRDEQAALLTNAHTVGPPTESFCPGAKGPPSLCVSTPPPPRLPEHHCQAETQNPSAHDASDSAVLTRWCTGPLQVLDSVSEL